jgi:N-acetylmuramoyl-L-alanine amidase
MLRMISTQCVASISRTKYFFILFALIPVLSSAAFRRNSEAAAKAFEEARQKRNEISQSDQPSLTQYLACASIYRSVYLKDPHYGRTGDAIYEEAIVYEESAERFSKPEYFRTAVKRFHLLVKDYGGNRHCPDALIRLGFIYSTHLDDEKSAQKAYQYLKTQYGYSSKSIQRIIQEKVGSQRIPSTAKSKALQPETQPAAASSDTKPVSGSSVIVQNIRFWSTSDHTRVIVDVDANARYEKLRLSDPERICLDISNAKLSPDLVNHTIPIGDEILKQVRVAQKSASIVRVVLDVTASSGLSVSELHDPFRIVIDVLPKNATTKPPEPVISSPAQNSADTQAKTPNSEGDQASSAPSKQPPMAVTELTTNTLKDKGSPNAAAINTPKENVPEIPAIKKDPRIQPPQKSGTSAGETERKSPPLPALETAPKTKVADSGTKSIPTSKAEMATIPHQAAPTSHGDRTLTRMLGLKVGRIVIDPGHGGHDLGTVGPGGLMEKDLVLSLARSLQKIVQEKLGAEVVLTREDDTFIPLEERTAIANQHKADLFISLHANSSRIHSISGVETYYLDFAKNDAEREIAARENATTENNVRDLEDLIKKIAKADKSTESRELASIIQKKLYAGSRQILPAAQNRGVRSAPFLVLIGASMPSVLAEVAFISNPKDERLLNKEGTKQSLVRALFAGIEGYMKNLGTEVVNNRASTQNK